MSVSTRMQSPREELTPEKFLERKWRKVFKILDLDHDGMVTLKDYASLGQRFAAESKISKERKAGIEQHFVNVWHRLYCRDRRSEQVTEDEFVDIYFEAGGPLLKQLIVESCPLFFQAIDADGDGFIPVEEFRNFFRLFSKDDSFAVQVFETLDVKKTGVLSVDEFVDAFLEYVTGTDQKSPYQFLFGSLNE